LEFAYRQGPVWTETLGTTCLAPFDVSSSGSILAWCLSVIFLLSAGVSLINSRLGKKFDDPDKGDVWYWTAFALVFLSLDTQVQFRETLRVLLIYASGTPLYHEGAVWWVTIYFFIFGLIAIRLLQDMWAYPPAALLLLLSMIGATLSQFIKIDALRVSETPEDVITLQTTLEAFAVLFLFLSLLLFGRRQVFRDPQVALQWFAKVWKQMPPMKKTIPAPTTASPTPVVQAPLPEPVVEATVTSDRGSNERPFLDKKNDDFALLRAS